MARDGAYGHGLHVEHRQVENIAHGRLLLVLRVELLRGLGQVFLAHDVWSGLPALAKNVAVDRARRTSPPGADARRSVPVTVPETVPVP